MEIYQNYWNDRASQWEFIKLDMKNFEKTDCEDFCIEYLDSYLNKKFPKELRNNFAEPISFIKAGFWAGIECIKLFYNISRK